MTFIIETDIWYLFGRYAHMIGVFNIEGNLISLSHIEITFSSSFDMSCSSARYFHC